MDIATRIEWARKEIESIHPGIAWRERVLNELDFCQAVLSGLAAPGRLEHLTMGLIAVRGLDEWGLDDLSNAISSIQHEMQQKYLSYAAKVRLGIHRRT